MQSEELLHEFLVVTTDDQFVSEQVVYSVPEVAVTSVKSEFGYEVHSPTPAVYVTVFENSLPRRFC